MPQTQTMQAYEIQIYHNGRWEFDSYFNDRDLVLTEAERMGVSGRYSGVRVLEETYNDETNKSDCKVIFSRLAKNLGPNADWRERAQRHGPSGNADGAGEPARRYAGPRAAAQPRKRTNPLALIALTVGLVLAGIGIIIVIRQLAGVA